MLQHASSIRSNIYLTPITNARTHSLVETIAHHPSPKLPTPKPPTAPSPNPPPPSPKSKSNPPHPPNNAIQPLQHLLRNPHRPGPLLLRNPQLRLQHLQPLLLLALRRADARQHRDQVLDLLLLQHQVARQLALRGRERARRVWRHVFGRGFGLCGGEWGGVVVRGDVPG